jgi:exonuclease III
MIYEVYKHRDGAERDKDGITLTNIRRLPSGRGLAGTFNGTCFVNMYAPSGAEKQEKETFHNTELPYLLPPTMTDLLTAGDFNCVLSQSDTTGQKNYSRSLDNLIRGYIISDVCTIRQKARQETCLHTIHRRELLDSTEYVSRSLVIWKQGVETTEAALTDLLHCYYDYFQTPLSQRKGEEAGG